MIIASYFWSAAGAGAALTVGVALIAGAIGLGVGYLITRMTAAGADTDPADGAARTAGSSMPAAAPAPSAPVEGAGALGVTPDPVDRAQAEMAAALLGQDPADQIEVIRRRAVDYLANSALSDDEDVALAWEDRARCLLAEELVPAELVELLLEHMLVDARCRADQLLAGVPDGVSGEPR